MEWNMRYGQGKRYCVTNHALKDPEMREEGRSSRKGRGRHEKARPFKGRCSVDGELRREQKTTDIAENSSYMADLEFDAAGNLVSVRYDLIRPAWKVRKGKTPKI